MEKVTFCCHVMFRFKKKKAVDKDLPPKPFKTQAKYQDLGRLKWSLNGSSRPVLHSKSTGQDANDLLNEWIYLSHIDSPCRGTCLRLPGYCCR